MRRWPPYGGLHMEIIPPARRLGQTQISLELVPLAGIRSNPHNAREHSQAQIAKLCRSITRFGFYSPVIIDETNRLLCGHARTEAARQIGLVNIPAVRAQHLSEFQKRALMLADNRLAELGSWNPKALRRELSFLSELDIDFDFGAIGFETPEVDFILGDDDGARDDIAPPVTADLSAVSRPGDLWHLNDHKVFCGSALKSASYRAVLSGDKADMVFTDPPYNVPIDGHVGGRGTVKHREFSMASGEMSSEQFVVFLQTWLDQVAAAVVDGAIVYACMDWRHTRELLQAANNLELKNICVWVKNNGGMGSLYRSQHEFVFVFKSGAAEHINNVQLGKHGRNRTNVWEYRGFSSFGSDRTQTLQSHPTVKPVALVADAVKDCSKRGGLILDPFGGSGTTLIAADRAKRRAALIEIDPLYVDLIIRRWQPSGRNAVLAATGETFADRERLIINP